MEKAPSAPNSLTAKVVVSLVILYAAKTSYAIPMPFWKRDPEPKTYWQGKAVAELPAYAQPHEKGQGRRITEIGEPVLHRRASDVEADEFGTEQLFELIVDMFTTMDIAEGVGLAAPQIGVDKQVFVFDVPGDDGNYYAGYVINPQLETIDAAGVTQSEGCLSVPGAHADLERASSVTVTGVDQDGKPVKLTGTGYLARAFLHEFQHLQGTLYYDHLSEAEQARVLAQRNEERPGVLALRRARAAELGKRAVTYPDQPPKHP